MRISDWSSDVCSSDLFPYSAPNVPFGVEPLPPSRKLGADYDTDWARRFPARMARLALLEGVIRPSVAFLGAPERDGLDRLSGLTDRSEEHTSELQSLMRISYAVFCLKKKKETITERPENEP